MGPVAASLATMDMGRVLLAIVLLGSYALALGQFAGKRGRLAAIAIAIVAASGFVVLSEPWEAGVILIAFAPVSMGLFAGVAWALWRLMPRSTRPAVLGLPALLAVPPPVARVSLLERLRTRLRFV